MFKGVNEIIDELNTTQEINISENIKNNYITITKNYNLASINVDDDVSFNEYYTKQIKITEAYKSIILDNSIIESTNLDTTNLLNEINIIKETVSVYNIETDESEIINQDIIVKSGWNWVSFYVFKINMTLNDLVISNNDNLNSDDNNYTLFIKNQTTFSEYYHTIGWIGGITQINNNETYLIKNNTTQDINISIMGLIPYSLKYNLSIGWNWIGYTSNEDNSLEILENPIEGDFIKSQTLFAEYYSEYGWIGNLKLLQPGYGYLYKKVE